MRLFLFVLVSIFGVAFCDELLSARCQSRCLHEMELNFQGTSDEKRNLKHHIIQLCKDDSACSSCAATCRDEFVELAMCKEATCRDVLDKKACERSCEHLQQIFTEKPGACPRMKNTSNYECTALCHLDGDCVETEKCCSYGCSRQCVLPRGKDARLLPVPISISVTERKRKRSVIIRWVMQKMTKEQANAISNLFVVQWRWGLHADDSAMTEWQTVTVRNKPYAILKHLLSPGRFYQFRVGAVSIHGSLGFSQPSEPFKLSKEAKAPTTPRDISLGGAKLTPIGLWNQVVQWSPPVSDLPIKNYQISWAVSSAAEADGFEEMMRRRATLDTQEKRSIDEEEEAWGIDKRDHHSVLVPSHATQAEVSGLFPNSVYIVEVHASVDSSEGELHGEKGIVFVRTSSGHPDQKYAIHTEHSESETEDETSTEEEEVASTTAQPLDVPTEITLGNTGDIVSSVADFDIKTPFYDGELQTSVNWVNSPLCRPGSKKYIVKVKKAQCSTYEPNHQSDQKWQEQVTGQCSATIRSLAFDCHYSVHISLLDDHETTLSGTFATSSCETTPSDKPIPCLSLTTPVFCAVHPHSVVCKWNRGGTEQGDTVIGYRIVLSSPTSEMNNITINPPHTREIKYMNLEPSTMYNMEVQAITNHGMGKSIATNFVTRSRLLDEEYIQRFPGGEIIELPLESSPASLNTIDILMLALPLMLLWR